MFCVPDFHISLYIEWESSGKMFVLLAGWDPGNWSSMLGIMGIKSTYDST